MNALRILNVIGCRPNLIKIAPLIAEMRRHSALKPLLVHTGQHYDDTLSDVFFRDLEIPEPDVCLNVGASSGARQAAFIMQRMEDVLQDTEPDLVLVVGDVTSTMAASVSASTLGYPVAHVEAGLRSFDREMPEEINRVVTDAVSDLLFATEKSAMGNLLREGKPRDRIFFSGNVMIDTLRISAPKIAASTVVADLGLTPGGYAVVTLHRSSNVDDARCLERIADAMRALQEHITLVFPVHPRTAQRMESFGCGRQFASLPNVKIIAPLGYVRFMRLLQDAALVLTDSGGVQEESTCLGIPCLTMRDNTERPVTLTEGTNQLIGTETDCIVERSLEILSGDAVPSRIPEKWDGHASERIVAVLLDQAEEIRQWHGGVRERAKCLDTLARV
jgi:UDP-N-acetylglucosamine 2-epimerase (non-hydrolysing)